MSPEMTPVRSALFVPGNRERWLDGAHEHGADVVFLDLEDSVPPGEKDGARELVAEYLPVLRAEGQRVTVRINGHPNAPTDHTEADLEAVVDKELESIVVPEPKTAEDVEGLDTVLTHIERRDGLDVGGTHLVLTIESALGMKHVHEMCAAADRVGSVLCGATKGADTNYALGFEWTGPGREGLETLHLREKALLDARAAGIEYPLSGPYVDVEDVEGLREDARFAREMGYTGYCVIHPSHVEPVNELFTPDAETIEYWRGVKQALREAEDEGKSAVRYEGEMIDTAHLDTAERWLRYADAFDIDAGE